MRPVSHTRRRIYFLIFSVAFVLLIPIVTLVASGYRLQGFKLVATGGMALYNIPEDAEVYMNYKPVKFGLLSRSFLLQNIAPGDYFIVVAKAGHWSWAKHLTVGEKRVSTASILLLPQSPKLTLIPEYEIEQRLSERIDFPFFNSTTTEKKVSSKYRDALDLFDPALNKKVLLAKAGTSTELTVQKTKDNVYLWKEGDKLYAGWEGTKNNAPFFFCNEKSCATTQVVFERGDITSYDFFPGRNDVALVLTSEGLYAVEIDMRTEQNLQPLYTAKGIDFRVDEEQLYIKEGNRLFEIEL